MYEASRKWIIRRRAVVFTLGRLQKVKGGTRGLRRLRFCLQRRNPSAVGCMEK